MQRVINTFSFTGIFFFMTENILFHGRNSRDFDFPWSLF